MSKPQFALMAILACSVFTGCNSAAHRLALADGQPEQEKEFQSLLAPLKQKCREGDQKIADLVIKSSQDQKVSSKDVLAEMNFRLAQYSGDKVSCAEVAAYAISIRSIAFQMQRELLRLSGEVKAIEPGKRTEAEQKEINELLQKLPTLQTLSVAQPEVEAHINWAFQTKSAPCGDCSSDRAACCASGCIPGSVGTGWLARNQIAAQAATAARHGGCLGAVGLLIQTQCHDLGAAAVLASHPDEVCGILSQH